MMRIRPDLWQSVYTGSSEVELTDQKRSYKVVATTECHDLGHWAAVPVPDTAFTEVNSVRVAFVDGVRRIDMHGIVDGNPPYYGVFGSVAAGCMRMCGSNAHDVGEALCNEEVRHYFVTNCPDADITPLKLVSDPSCPFDVRYEIHSSSSHDPADFGQELNNLMQELEHRVAQQQVDRADVQAVVTDGPIPYEHQLAAGTGKLAGIIKNVQEAYLGHDQFATVLILKAAERTPIFEIRYPDSSGSSKMSFFLRLCAVTPFGSAMANLVRIELPVMGLTEAIHLANLASAIAVHYSSNLWGDTRAPQNLYPVGALETALKNRLGDQRFLRSVIMRTLAASDAAPRPAQPSLPQN
ncbi:MAG: DNA double-strand break repair nuclease NurA [Candidatus Cryosericum sp.]